eukprot:12292866-Alexandrium_andersonii.AAC.1
MRWTTACGPIRTSGSTSTPSPRATACGSTQHGPSCSGAFPRRVPSWAGLRSSLEPVPGQGRPEGARLVPGFELKQLN